MPLVHRAARAAREVAPFMLLASVGCLIVSGLIGFSMLLDDRTVADRLLVAVGWLSWAGLLFVAARLSEKYA